MEISVGISRAVRRNEKVCIFKIRRIHGDEFNLYRPLRQLTAYRYALSDSARIVFDYLGLCAGATARQSLSEFLHFGLFHRLFVVCRSLSFFKRNCTRGTSRQTISESVAIVFENKLCFAVILIIFLIIFYLRKLRLLVFMLKV